MKSLSIVPVLVLVSCNALLSATAFQTPAPSLTATPRQSSLPNAAFLARQPPQSASPISYKARKATAATTHLSMYNLPPSGGGGGGNNDNVIKQVLGGALTIGAIVLFFVSPLGAIFFAITNSLFLLALITPVILTIAFQVWRSLNTINGSCPSCGAPNQVVLKDPDQVSFCLNCGAFLQASSDLKSVELANPTGNRGGGGDFIDMGSGNPNVGSIFDQMFGGGGFGGGGAPEQSLQSVVKDKEQKFKRERTIIDVEVSKDERFQ